MSPESERIKSLEANVADKEPKVFNIVVQFKDKDGGLGLLDIYGG